MTEKTVPPPSPRRRRGWLRVLALAFGILIVLIVVAYFVATSSAFFKGVILPKVSAALNADVTVSDASVHPFREVLLQNLKVQAKGQEPVVTAPEVRLRYSLMDILRGTMHVDEVVLVSPTVQWVEHADGTRNIDPLLKAQEQKPAAKQRAPEAKPSKPAQIDLRKLALNDATIRQEKLYRDGKRDLAELTNVNVMLTNVKNGETGKLVLSAAVNVQNNPPAPGAYGVLQATIEGAFNFSLSPDLKPANAQGRLQFTVSRADGNLGALAAFATIVDCDVSSTQVKQVAVTFEKSGARLGRVVASGPFDIQKNEGRITVELLGVDKRLLNLAGAGSGLDFGSTTINSTNQIELQNSGAVMGATGRLEISKLQLAKGAERTPTLNLHADYDLTVNRAQSNAVVRAIHIVGTQNEAPLLDAHLTSPMTLAWGGGHGAGDSTLDVAVTNFNLADWKPFLGNSVSAGRLEMKAQIASRQDGKQVAFNLDSSLNGLEAQAGTNRVTQADIIVAINGQAQDLKQFNLAKCRLEIARQNQPVASLAGAGTYNTADSSADLQIQLQAFMDRLLQLAPQPNLTASSGTLSFAGRVTQKQDTRNVSGTMTLAELTGRLSGSELRNFGATIDLDAATTPQQVQLRKLNGKLTQDGQSGGSFGVSGAYDLTNKAAHFNLHLADLNQNGLGPFLQPALGNKKLASVAVNGSAALQYDPDNSSSVKADLQVTNLVVKDPAQTTPAAPLEARLAADASLQKQTADLRQLQITLTPTQRAQNQVRLSGQVDFSQTNAIQGALKLAADSLDLTSYYDLLSGQKQVKPEESPAAAKPSAAPAAASAPANTEPPAQQLPFRNFAIQANIGKLYLHEVEITNLAAGLNLDGGHVLIKPCGLVLNGAPANASVDLDLGVPGYKYAVAFDADQVPFAPLADTFSPSLKGAVSGTASVHVQLNGAGTTGANLHKNLNGQFDVGTTNLNLAISKLPNPLIRDVVQLVTLIPDAFENPLQAASLLVKTAAGRSDASQELTKSPIDVIAARGVAGGGAVQLQQATVRSPAFEVNAHDGTVTLADVLTNSPINIPVSISLVRSVAERLKLASPETSTNAAYVKLPDFFTETGTLGEPKRKINYVALLKAGGAAAGINIPGTHIKPGGVLQNLGILGGQPTNNANTNQPPSGQKPLNNLLNRFLK